MQGEWRFWRETGELWQIGHFRDGGHVRSMRMISGGPNLWMAAFSVPMQKSASGALETRQTGA